MRIVITGIGFRSALGDLTTTWRGILNHQSAIRLVKPFADLPLRPLALIDPQPQHVLHLTRTVVAAAITDGNLSLPLPDCGVTIGSSRSCQSDWEQLTSNSTAQTDLTQWLDTLPHSPAIETARYIGSRTAVLAPMAACATGIWSLAQAVGLIRSEIGRAHV